MPEQSPNPANQIPIPAPFDQLGERPFSFFPAIIGIEHNEWNCTGATWSEAQVVNAKSGQELWIPRAWVGELSRIDQPVAIIGLKRELEFRMGGIWPYERRILEMPKPLMRPGGGTEEPANEPRPESGLLGAAGRLDSNERRIGRLILIALLIGVGACAIVIALYRGRNSAENVTFTGILQTNLGLTASDDYFAIVRKLGTPGEDKWRAAAGQGDMQFRVLRYPERKMSVILMARDQKDALYIGAVDLEWRVIDSVDLPGHVNTASMIRRLARF